MSSGIEILILAPLLLPALAGAGTIVTAGASAAGAAATGAGSGAVVVSGGSIVTTGAFATGTTAGGGTAAGAASAGAAVAGTAVLVVGAAAAAVLAAHHLQSSYDTALSTYHQRLEAEKAPVQAANKAHQQAMSAALLQAGKTRVRAAESAELAFLRAGAQKLQQRVAGWPDIDPRVPGACAKLLAAIDGPSPDTTQLFAAYEKLGSLVSQTAAKQREGAIKALGANPKAASLQVVTKAIVAEVAALRDDVVKAPGPVLSDKAREDLKRSLSEVESLASTQPRLSSQGLQMLRGRIGRELSLGAAREAKRREEQESKSARLRELAGRISARSQATLSVLDNAELASSPLAQPQIALLQQRATRNLEGLAALLSKELPAGLAPLETLSRQSDELFDETAGKLQQIAQQLYLESQVAEVFTQLGYQVSTGADAAAETSGLIAKVDSGHGIEIQLDGAGNMKSEMVAFSPSTTEVEPQAQEKVCALMDEVFDLLRARGCGIREKKRRHVKKGDRNLRVVKVPAKAVQPAATIAAPMARRAGE